MPTPLRARGLAFKCGRRCWAGMSRTTQSRHCGTRTAPIVTDGPALRRVEQAATAAVSAAPIAGDPQFDGAEFVIVEGRLAELRAAAQSPHAPPGPPALCKALEVSEVVNASTKLNTGRASYYMGMRSELLRFFTQYNDTRRKVADQPFFAAWTAVLNGIFNGSPIPDEWRMQMLCPVYKGRDSAGKPLDPLDPSNYRPIVVCSRIIACLDVVVNARLMEFCLANKLISTAQYGFIQGRNVDQATAAATMQREFRATGTTPDERRTYVALIDLRRAFDTTWRARLWVRLHDKGITGTIWSYLQRSNVCCDYYRCVLIPGEPVDTWYTDGLGCAQGVITAPLLFDLEFNDALEALADVNVPGAGVTVGERRITGQLFADDLLIPSATLEGLQALVNAFAAYCYKTRRRINVSKCD